MSEQDKLREHEFDGIQEFDNRLPNWWLWTLFGAIAFAVGYWLTFHTWGFTELPLGRYRAEMAAAAQAQLARMGGTQVSNESLVLMSQVPDRVTAGATVFQQVCVTCHRPDGSGDVGPNLTDEYWMHGREPMDIHNTVTNGVPDKGMVAWLDQLGPKRIQDVVAYVLTLQDQNLPGKAPQGYSAAGEIAPGWTATVAAPAAAAAPPAAEPAEPALGS